MARGVNKVILIGNVGADPEIRYMPSGGAVASLTLATTETWKDKQTGEKQERTEWHRISCFNRLGEIAGEYVKKGSRIYIEGSLRTRKWQDAQGQDRYTTEIIASEMQLLDSRNNNYNNQDESQGYAPAFQQNTAPTSSARPAQQNENANANAVLSELDDDIPF